MEIRATEKDLTRHGATLSIDNIRLWHLRTPLIKIQSAKKITITIGNETRVLKNVYGEVDQ